MAKALLLSIRGYARHRGCAPSAVVKALDEVRITPVIDAKGRRWIDPEVADIQWAKNTRARADSARPDAATNGGEGVGVGDAEKTAPAPDSGPAAQAKSAYSDFRAQTEAENLRRLRRDNEVAEGKLVSRQVVERAVFDAFRVLRDRAMVVAQRAAPKCIGMADVRDIERVFDAEQRQAFADFDADMKKRLPRPAGYLDDGVES